MNPNERLRIARKARHFKSAAQAAEAMGAAYGTYSGHENGLRGIPRDEILRYASFFRVSPGWLDYGEGEMELMLPGNILEALRNLEGPYLTKAAELILMVKGLQDNSMALPTTPTLQESSLPSPKKQISPTTRRNL
ncbi:hypothetical protein [Pseudochelatococcus sp. G4_1912]|uniref:hypothetical protein n=1 Tax=Pseudochelatococcus sp. G4_1912 TaxID=3114288 RepID=UPI0039C6A9BC